MFAQSPGCCASCWSCDDWSCALDPLANVFAYNELEFSDETMVFAARAGKCFSCDLFNGSCRLWTLKR